MTKDELHDTVTDLKQTFIATRKNAGDHLDARELIVLDKLCDLGVAIAGAILSIAESQDHIAKGTKRDWKPGDDVG